MVRSPYPHDIDRKPGLTQDELFRELMKTQDGLGHSYCELQNMMEQIKELHMRSEFIVRKLVEVRRVKDKG